MPEDQHDIQVRIFAPDRSEIRTLGDWWEHAPPENPEVQWRARHSAQEGAKAWFRDGDPSVPVEILEALGQASISAFDEVYARPEHKTKLDEFNRARQHDVFACARAGGETVAVLGIEAKARENYAGRVIDSAKSEPNSKKPARCNLMSRALFDKPVFDEASRKVLNRDLADHGYQLWTAAVGTIREAQSRGVDEAVLVVHQFQPRVPEDAEENDWVQSLARNQAQFDAFRSAIGGSGRSHETEFVKAGTRLSVVKATGFVG